MHTQTQSLPVSTGALWSGWILGGLAVLFLIFDGVIKVLNLPVAVEATTQLGYPSSAVVGIGILQLVCLVLYVLPPTAILGAILLTGYLGGAIATHVRAGSDLFSLIFPAIIGLLLWGALYLTEPRLRALAPLRKNQ